MKAIDIFSGVGGLSLGAARAGLEISVAVENDKNALKAHKKNFSSTIHIDKDVINLSGDALVKAAKKKGRRTDCSHRRSTMSGV